MEETYLTVNGQLTDGRYRIDNMLGMKPDMDPMEFLRNPWAIARDFETAEFIVKTINAKAKTTPEQFAEEMAKFPEHDPEIDHEEADQILCRVLEELGYEAGIKLYHGIKKWYA